MNIPFEFENDKAPDLVDLIPTMPIDMVIRVSDKKESVSQEEEKFLEKVSRAAENGNIPIVRGIGAIGVLLANANDDVPLETFNDIGWLIKALSDQTEALNYTKQEADAILNISRKNKIIKGNGGLMS
ncbi:hypothetical protein [Acinetobacter guerrae]|uniref:hypothetical protein n=1 Tax=Acinetobacter guerrae TaxID=1843371 RepID=UPI00128E1C9E|nr:hypothetical protein [Acinetobacter guerrae]MPW44797.1 hypothetical protein [Acinetobacter guerrae]